MDPLRKMSVREYRVQQIAVDEGTVAVLHELRHDLMARIRKIENRLKREKLLLEQMG